MIEAAPLTPGDLLGFLITAVGLGFAIYGAQGAKSEAQGAKSAAQAAQSAAHETRSQIARHLQSVDLQRAIDRIQRIKTLQSNDRWEAANEHYQPLREMLAHVLTHFPEERSDDRNRLALARASINDAESHVAQGKGDLQRMNRTLSDIQSDLEKLASELAPTVPPQGVAR